MDLEINVQLLQSRNQILYFLAFQMQWSIQIGKNNDLEQVLCKSTVIDGDQEDDVYRND